MHVKTYVKTENIIRVEPNDTLSHVLNMLSSSHDSAFVFDGETFMGVINPYYCLAQKVYPAHTKVKNALFHPPKLDIKDSIEKAAGLMIESKIHYLPIFERGKFVAIISARRIITRLRDSDAFLVPLSKKVREKSELVSIYEDDPVSKALHLFKQHKVSKLIVLSPEMKLKGVLSYYDLLEFISVPKERQDAGAMKGTKDSKLSAPVKRFYRKNILTLGLKHTFKDVADSIVEKQIGSVIVVDAQKNPVGIVTTSDLLNLLTNKYEKNKLHTFGQGLSQQSKRTMELFSNRISLLLKNKRDVEEAEITIREKKQGGVFEAALSILRKNQGWNVIHKEGKNLAETLQEIKKKAKRLLQKEKE